MKNVSFQRLLPYLLLGLALLIVLSYYGRNMKVAGGDEGFDFHALAKTVVMDDGRAKPLDAVARNTLLVLYNKQKLVHEGEKIDAIVWMMDLLARPNVAHDYKVFRIDHPDVIELLGLRPSDGADDKFFSYNQVLAGRTNIFEQSQALEEKTQPTVYDRGVLELAQKISLYEQFAIGRRPLVIPPRAATEDAAWQPYLAVLQLMSPESQAGQLQVFYDIIRVTWQRELDARAIPSFFAEQVEQGRLPKMVLNAAVLYSAYKAGPTIWDGAIDRLLHGQDEAETEAGRAYYKALYASLERMDADKSLWTLLQEIGLTLPSDVDGHWLDVITAYRAGDAQAFNTALTKRAEVLGSVAAAPVKKAGFEVFFNQLMPFVLAEVLNVLGFVLAFIALYFGRSEKGTWGRSVWLGMMLVLCAAFAVHSFGLVARMWITGRPPVTDLYSSAVLVGWACVGVCLLIEWLTKRGIGGIVAATCGFATLIIAHHLHLQNDGDTMAPMRAVLDSNFWLATHVIVVTLGYAATFVAGMLAIVYIIKGMATPTLSRAEARQLTQMVYGTICFALLLSFVGTVLGGIWADQSWGRFWGWDPKENGAVMIVIMNAIILHAKWGRLVRERGIMVLAVGGNIITAWSWFGTNQLGVGLHAYGFTDGTVRALTLFVASQMLIMSAAMVVPTHLWWSFRKPKQQTLR